VRGKKGERAAARRAKKRELAAARRFLLSSLCSPLSLGRVSVRNGAPRRPRRALTRGAEAERRERHRERERL
jgi:hypothetical protein